MMTILYSHIEWEFGMEQISKSDFKAHALEVLRDIEKSGQSRIITDRGNPTLEIRKLRSQKQSPLEILKGTVIKYEAATLPVADDDWENS
jgi:antitoxin (DNA-binding transcriptional repressor) of toxin-antitoxin stability system